MLRAFFYTATALSVIVSGHTVITAQSDMKTPATLASASMPMAKKVPHVLKIHGYEITDNYFWLRDRNDKKDPEIIKFLEDNNAYTTSFMGKHQPFVDALYTEMLARIKQTDTTVPYEKGGWWYFNTTKEGEQYPRYFRSRSEDLSSPQLLLDQNEMAKGLK